MEQEEWSGTLTANIHGIRLFYKITTEALDNWPGGDPIEQEYLFSLKNTLFALMCEYNLDMLDK
tara:strand:- start:1120 stop:1311 length:192 start_codon:yes stop_codon:yes gene_type:complete